MVHDLYDTLQNQGIHLNFLGQDQRQADLVEKADFEEDGTTEKVNTVREIIGKLP
ncbi:MAG: hypothetical protein YK1309IOTA_1690009 [Marine Group I thaumarchaeote]|nr:MAG: hypothetical protein YK1309IOTA_1690009 [Marine Group I thaumarchaeote]